VVTALPVRPEAPQIVKHAVHIFPSYSHLAIQLFLGACRSRYPSTSYRMRRLPPFSGIPSPEPRFPRHVELCFAGIAAEHLVDGLRLAGCSSSGDAADGLTGDPCPNCQTPHRRACNADWQPEIMAIAGPLCPVQEESDPVS
jgi:hypothetical protein